MPTRRVLSFFVLVILLIVATLLSRGPGAILTYLTVTLLTIAGTGEFYGLVEKKGVRPDKLLGVMSGAVLVSAVFLRSYSVAFPAGSFVVPASIELLAFFLITIGIFSHQLFKVNEGSAILSASSTLAGVVYVAWLFSFILRIMYFPGLDGRWYVFFLFLVTKGADTCAYLAGKAFGRNKLIPRISPSKTKEGLVGHLGGALIGGLIGFYWFGQYCAMPALPRLLLLSAVMGLVAIPGDLFESTLKRDAGVKDVAGYLPGLGGVLDVVDSVLFTAPLLYLYLVMFK